MSSLEIILELSHSHLETRLFDRFYFSPDIGDDLCALDIAQIRSCPSEIVSNRFREEDESIW
jgi:hypothetical protein